MNTVQMGRRSLAAAVVLGLVAVVAGGCGGCGKANTDSMPTSAQARIEQMTGYLPATTEVAFVAGDLGQARGALTNLHERVGKVVPAVHVIQQEIQSEFGVNIISAESWQQAGINPGGGIVVGFTQNRPILLTYVEDRAAFETTFVDRAKKAFNIDQPVKTEQVDGHQVKLLSQTPARDLGWLYDGKVAIVALPAVDTEGAMEGGSASAVLGQLVATKKDASLAAEPRFKKFYEALGKEYPLSVYVNPAKYFENPEFERAQQNLRAGAMAMVEWSKKNTTSVGFGLEVKANQLQIRTFVDAPKETLAAMRGAQKGAGKIDWKSFATDKTLVGLRSSADLPKMWSAYLEGLSDDQRRAVRRDLQEFGKNFGIDVEGDLIEALTGNAAVFFYGVDVPALMDGAGKDPMKAISALGLIVNAQFQDKNKLEGLVQKLNTAGQGLLSLRHLADDEGNAVDAIQVLEIKNLATTPGAAYFKDDTFTFATSAFSESSMHQYLTGTRDDKPLVDAAELDLGKRFAAGEGFNGLYINFVRAAEHFGPYAAMVPMVGQTLNQLEELLIEAEATDAGMFGTLTLDLR